jgi:hypothetical protein
MAAVEFAFDEKTMSAARKPRGPRSKPVRKGPSEIAPGVFVGGWKDALAFTGQRFCVLDEAPEEMPSGTHIPIYQSETSRAITPNLDRLARSVQQARARDEPVLIFCGHGIRRSGLGGAWYLRRAEALSLDSAYARVRSVRPKVEHAREWVANADELEGAQ